MGDWITWISEAGGQAKPSWIARALTQGHDAGTHVFSSLTYVLTQGCDAVAHFECHAARYIGMPWRHMCVYQHNSNVCFVQEAFRNRLMILQLVMGQSMCTHARPKQLCIWPRHLCARTHDHIDVDADSHA